MKKSCRVLMVSAALGFGCGAETNGPRGEPPAGDAGPDRETVDGADGATNQDVKPPQAQASVSIHVQEYDRTDPAHGMDVCPPSRHWMDVPYDRERLPTTQRQQTSAQDVSVRAVNGQNGDAVACTVKRNGDGFSVTADATGYAELVTEGLKFKPTVVHIRIPSITPGNASAPGTLAIQDDASVVTYMSQECTFLTQGDSLGIAVGSIWAAMKCENLMDAASPGAACQVDTGFFVFENCAEQ